MYFDTDNLYSEETEAGSIIKNDKDNFYTAMKQFGFDFEDLAEDDSKLPKSLQKALSGDLEHTLKFNSALLTLHRNKRFNIIESIVNLTTDYVDYNDLAKILQPNVLGLLTSELATKHKLCTITSTSAINKFIH